MTNMLNLKFYIDNFEFVFVTTDKNGKNHLSLNYLILYWYFYFKMDKSKSLNVLIWKLPPIENAKLSSSKRKCFSSGVILETKFSKFLLCHFKTNWWMNETKINFSDLLIVFLSFKTNFIQWWHDSINNCSGFVESVKILKMKKI